MKLSASVYSNSVQDLHTTIDQLEGHHIDMLHVDCNDDPKVFDDVKKIRLQSKLPIDLHLITSEPQRYAALLAQDPVEFLTLQFENLKDGQWPSAGFQKLGLAITSSTPIEVFADHADKCDFVLLMATTPGKSGGEFDKDNFRRIREFKKRFPNKRIHVDGGVNAEVSFILRNLGVHCAVSGSFLFNQRTVGSAVLGLKNGEASSRYLVKDFMLGLDETPTVTLKDLGLRSVLESIENGRMSFTAIINAESGLEGIVSNADVRKGLLKQMDDLSSLAPETLMNRNPIVVNEDQTVAELLRFIRHQPIPINFLPVVNSQGKLTGSLTFNDLIKGES